MELAFLGPETLSRVLSMADAMEALEDSLSGSDIHAPDRSHLDTGTGDLLLMPAWADDVAGVKLVTVAPGNPKRGLPLIQGVYVLFEQPTLTPVALFDATALTALRTGAVSGVATKHLAREDASYLVIFGAGVQAHAHLDAMVAAREIDKVRVVSRSPDRARALAEKATAMGLDADVRSAEVVRRAGIVCTCTTSPEPVFDGKLLSPGVHINAIGSYTPSARELDDFVMDHATVVVDTRAALNESGDLVVPIEDGRIAADDVRDLATVVKEGAGRGSDGEITVFKSVGAAFEDLVVARAAARRL